MKSKTTLSLFLSTMVILSACANIDNQSPEDNVQSKSSAQSSLSQTGFITEEQAERFSTSGKATKLRLTPKGPVEIYNIAKDAEVAQAIKELYADGNLTFGDVSFKDYNVDYDTFFSPKLKISPAAILLTKARQISYYDLYRSSCQKVERVPCGNLGSGFDFRYYSDCPTCYLGQPPKHNDERIVYSSNRVAEGVITNDLLKKGRWPNAVDNGLSTAIINECRDISKQPLLPYYYIGEQSGYSLEETQKFLLHHQCGDE